MGFLRCNLALAPRHTKEVAYKALVRPQLEYAAPILNPCHKLQFQEVKKVQRTAARWTCRRWRNTSSVGDMLDELEWPSLEARREQSINTYFQERCVGGCKSANFWTTIKPYLSKQSNQGQSKIIFNYFVNVAENIGKDYMFDPKDQPRFNKIKELNLKKDAFSFKLTDESCVSKIIDRFNPKKATDGAKISVKLLKLGKRSLVKPTTNLISTTISASTFPSIL